MVKQYLIGGIVLQIESSFDFQISGEEEFACSGKKADFIFEFRQVDDIPALMANGRFITDVRWADVYRLPDGTYLRAFRLGDYYHAVSVIHSGRGTCCYISDDMLELATRDGFEVFNFLCIEEILRQFGAMVLHSSHIRTRDRGLVFSAPSQTGKSTQARLWELYEGALVLNGDRSVLRKEDGVWYVYGCPMSGTSGIHLQGCNRLSNIVMLSQGKDNQLRRIGGREAFSQLFPQITVPSWDGHEMEVIMNLIDELISDVPVWHYCCTKEADAVYDLKNRLFGEGDES